MATVGTYEAKTNLPELLHRVEAGESITITRHGKPVARLVPFNEAMKETPEEIVAAMRKIRSRSKKGGPSIRELINQGRRF